MHQIHCKIEEVGFDLFSAKSGELASRKKGRFRSFDGVGPIQSISDLRETPDRKVLIIIDGMNLIETNQRQRLEHCLDMRIQGARPEPGEEGKSRKETGARDRRISPGENRSQTDPPVRGS